MLFPSIYRINKPSTQSPKPSRSTIICAHIVSPTMRPTVQLTLQHVGHTRVNQLSSHLYNPCQDPDHCSNTDRQISNLLYFIMSKWELQTRYVAMCVTGIVLSISCVLRLNHLRVEMLCASGVTESYETIIYKCNGLLCYLNVGSVAQLRHIYWLIQPLLLLWSVFYWLFYKLATVFNALWVLDTLDVCVQNNREILSRNV